jgi:SsrA-binding protein
VPKKSKKPAGNVVASNPRARHDYHIEETFEAGIALTGSEVKSLRSRQASLREAFAIVRDGEAFLIGMHIAPYHQAGYAQHEPTRTRKLLLHKDEIRRLAGKTTERGLTLIPLQCYFSHGLAKVELGVARGKKKYDRREDIKEREAQRQIDRALRRRR